MDKPMTFEEWLPVRGYEDLYEVSSLGKVRSLIFRNRTSNRKRLVPKLLKPTKQRLGYYRVNLRGKQVFVHVLILEAFKGIKPSGYETGHLNGVRGDNRLENLQWVSRKENAQQRVGHGTQVRGMQLHNSKVTDSQVFEMRLLRSKGLTSRSISRQFKLSESETSSVLRGKTWKHVPMLTSTPSKEEKV